MAVGCAQRHKPGRALTGCVVDHVEAVAEKGEAGKFRLVFQHLRAAALSGGTRELSVCKLLNGSVRAFGSLHSATAFSAAVQVQVGLSRCGRQTHSLSWRCSAAAARQGRGSWRCSPSSALALVYHGQAPGEQLAQERPSTPAGETASAF